MSFPAHKTPHVLAGRAGTDVWAFSSCLLEFPTVRIISDSYVQVALPFLADCPGVGVPLATYGAKEVTGSAAKVRVLEPDVRLQALVALTWCVAKRVYG